MPSFLKGKSKESKSSTAHHTGIELPGIQIEETAPDVRSFRNKAKNTIQSLFSRRSHSRATSQGPSEKGRSQENLPSLDATPSPSVGDKSQSAEIKSNPGKSLKPTDLAVGCVDSASEQRTASVKETPAHLPTTFQDAVHESEPQDHATPAVLKNVRHLRDDGTTAIDSSHQWPDIRVPSEQEITGSQLHGAHNFTIGNSRFENIGVKNEYNYSSVEGTYATTIFNKFVSFKALYDSAAQDPTRRVHPETRQRVLKCIRDWIDTPNAKERIFWLHGPAGVGKSAIAQTIAESCSRGQLVATFFFFRSDPSRNDGDRLFITLAWQFAFAIPATKSVIICSLNEHPDIPMKRIETQFEELIVKPFLALKGSGIELCAPVVIIDGVDECSDDSLQRRFLKLIGNAVKDDRVPLRFLICSRPEAHIQDTVNIFQSLTLSLDLAKLDDANEDIEKYLRVEFSRIAIEQELDSAWPGEEIIQEFVYKASGQFIYASTVVKYVGDEYFSAESQLEIIRGLKPPLNISPFAELDELYKEILRRQRDPVFLKDFLSMLIGRHEAKKDRLNEDDTLLMNVSEKELHRKLRGMRSILKFDPYIDVHHRSFFDFLQDPTRSGEYHINKEAGARRYLDFIVGALVRYASTVNVQHDDHFDPWFYKLSANYPAKHVMSVEEWQQALQPLLELQDKLLASPNFRIWKFLLCQWCTGFHTIRNLLLHLTFLLGFSGCNSHPALMASSDADKPEHMHSSVIIDLPETHMNVLEKDLDACLSSLLLRLRLCVSLDRVTIQLFCSLLHFDHVEITARLRSISDGQNLVDLIDELINNEHFCSDYGPSISRKIVLLALEIFGTVPILPRSLFEKGTVGPHPDIKRLYNDEMELLFQTVFMSKILDSNYVVRVLWVYQDQQRVLSVADKMNENNEPLSKWRKRSSPSLATQIRIMFEVAKAIQYFHSIDVVLHDEVDSNHIFLDSELHPKFRFLGLTDRYVQVSPLLYVTPEWLSREDNVLLFGCLFYEMCFYTKISHHDRISPAKVQILAILANRPPQPDIGDNVWQLIRHCCTKDRKSRLSMDAVVKEMEGWDII